MIERWGAASGLARGAGIRHSRAVNAVKEKEKHVKTGNVVVGVVLVCLCVAVAGCGKAAEKIGEKMAESAIERETGGKAKVDIQGDSMKVVTKDGEHTVTVGDKAAAPKDFPSDVAIYEGAKITASVSVPDGMQVHMQTKDSPDKVIASYQAMTKDGWTQEALMDMGEQKTLSLKKGERTVVVMASLQDKMTTVMLTVPKEKKGTKAE